MQSELRNLIKLCFQKKGHTLQAKLSHTVYYMHKLKFLLRYLITFRNSSSSESSAAFVCQGMDLLVCPDVIFVQDKTFMWCLPSEFLQP